MRLIDKDYLVTELKRRNSLYEENYHHSDKIDMNYYGAKVDEVASLLRFLDTLEVKEVVISIPNIDDLFEEEGIDPNSKEAKVFKECYYMALEKLKEEKGEEI